MLGCFAAHEEAKQFDAQALEKAIDAVGRDKVFALARANGWSMANTPPPYIWWSIVNELRAITNEGD